MGRVTRIVVKCSDKTMLNRDIDVVGDYLLAVELAQKAASCPVAEVRAQLNAEAAHNLLGVVENLAMCTAVLKETVRAYNQNDSDHSHLGKQLSRTVQELDHHYVQELRLAGMVMDRAKAELGIQFGSDTQGLAELMNKSEKVLFPSSDPGRN